MQAILNSKLNKISINKQHKQTSRNTVPADLLWEENTVPIKKTNWKVRIIRQANMAVFYQTFHYSTSYMVNNSESAKEN